MEEHLWRGTVLPIVFGVHNRIREALVVVVFGPSCPQKMKIQY